MSSQEIIDRLATEHQFRPIRDLFEAVVMIVSRASTVAIVWGKDIQPDIRERCTQIRKLLQQQGIEVPQEDEELYHHIIHPVFFRQIERAL